MKISSRDRINTKENSGYGSEGKESDDDVAVVPLKKKAMHELNYRSEDDNLALVPFSTPKPSSQGKRKKKLIKEMHGEFDDKVSKKAPQISFSNIELSDPTHKSRRSKQVKVSSIGLQSPDGTDSRAVIRAVELQSSLDPKFPNFIKQMRRSHVCKGFWMGLPKEFCKSHLPKNNVLLTLENEMGQKFQMNYIAYKLGLSGGWKDFAIAHRLLLDDVLIFQLVEPTRFKVYIIRANESDEVDRDVALQSDAEEDGTEHYQKTLAQKIRKRKRSKSLQCDVQMNKKTDSGKSVSSELQLANTSENGDSETGTAIIPSQFCSSSPIHFREVKSFDDFTITVDDLCINSELPDDLQAKYYALCSAKKSFLHDQLMEGLNSKLIAGVICEIIDIADSIKQCSSSTCREEFSSWEKALISFEHLGMNVGFLRARIKKLLKLFFESRKYMEANLRRVKVEDEMMKVKSKLVELEKTYKKCGKDVKDLKFMAESYEQKFQEEVDAPW